MQLLHPSVLMTYVPSRYRSKYTTVVLSILSLTAAFLYFISCSFCITKWTSNIGAKSWPWITSHYFILQGTKYYKHKQTKSHYIIFFQYFLLLFYVITISRGEGGSPWFQYVLFQSWLFPVLVQYRLLSIMWNII